MGRQGFTVKEVAEMLGLSVETVRRELRRGRLQGKFIEGGKTGRRGTWVITQFDLEAYLGQERAQRTIELYLQDKGEK